MIKRHECVLDTNFLAELITQYDFKYPNELLKINGIFTKKVVNLVNSIIANEEVGGRIVASSLAFVEISNKFSEISESESRFGKSKMLNFIKQPPIWFIIEPLDINTCKKFISIPKNTYNDKKIELTDACHVATAMQRGKDTYFATTDQKIWDINYQNLEIILIK